MKLQYLNGYFKTTITKNRFIKLFKEKYNINQPISKRVFYYVDDVTDQKDIEYYLDLCFKELNDPICLDQWQHDIKKGYTV